MIALFKFYGIGILAAMCIVGYLNAAYALQAKVTMKDGTALFSHDAAIRQLALVFIWPLALIYVVSYYVMVYFMLYELKREMKRNPAPIPPPIPEPIRPVDPSMN